MLRMTGTLFLCLLMAGAFYFCDCCFSADHSSKEDDSAQEQTQAQKKSGCCQKTNEDKQSNSKPVSPKQEECKCDHPVVQNVLETQPIISNVVLVFDTYTNILSEYQPVSYIESAGVLKVPLILPNLRIDISVSTLVLLI